MQRHAHYFRYLLLALLSFATVIYFSGCGPEDKCIVDDGTRYLVVKPKSGFGNRIQAVASANAWAARLNRKLIIDWQVEDAHMPATWSELFRAPSIDLLEENRAVGQCGRDFLYKREGGKHGKISRYIQKLPGMLEPSIDELESDQTPVAVIFHAESRMPSKNFPEQKAQIASFYKSLVPVPEVSQKVNAVLAQQQRCDTKIGIHFRNFSTRGDWTGVATPVEKFLDHTKREITDRKISLSSKSCLYVASDDPEKRKEIEDNLVAAYGAKLFRLGLSEVERDTVSGQRDALIEWFTLGKMDFLFGSDGSTLSDEAGRLTTHGAKISVGDAAYGYHVNSIDPL